MSSAITRSLKLTVPVETTRDHLLEFSRKLISTKLKLRRFEIESMTVSHSKSESVDEMTYRIEYVNLLPN